MKTALTFFVLAMVSILAGCATVQPKIRFPAVGDPTSYLQLTPAQAVRMTSEWCSVNGRMVMSVGYGSRSMAPLVVPGDMLLCQAYLPIDPCPDGTLVIFKVIPKLHGKKSGAVLHRVKDERAAAVYVSGDNNFYSDGWLLKRDMLWTVPVVIRITNL